MNLFCYFSRLGTKAWNDSNDLDELNVDTTFHINESGVMTSESRNVPELVDEQMPCLNRLRSYPKIVFLGTSGSIATLYRNVTSILIHTG